jgi:hypothetical protein
MLTSWMNAEWYQNDWLIFQQICILFDISRPVYSQKSSWVVRNPSNTDGVKTVKTVYSSRSLNPVNEPMALQSKTYQTGSQSMA